MNNCCDFNMDGKVIVDGKLDSPTITNGKLLDTDIGVDCEGNAVKAGSPIVTCKEFTQAKADIDANKQGNLADTHGNPLKDGAVVLQPEDVTAITAQLQTKQDGLKDLNGKPLEGGTAVVDKDSFEALKASKQEALTNCDGKPLGTGEKVPDCGEFNSALDKKQDTLKDENGTPLAGGTSVVSLTKFNAIVNTIQGAVSDVNNWVRDNKQDNLLDCDGKRLAANEKMVKCTDLEAAKTELKDEIGKVSGASFKRGDGSPMKGTESLPTYDEFTDQVDKINNSITDVDKKINNVSSSSVSTQTQVAATELASAGNGGTLPTLIAGGTDVLLGRPDLLLQVDLGEVGTFYLPLFKKKA